MNELMANPAAIFPPLVRRSWLKTALIAAAVLLLGWLALSLVQSFWGGSGVFPELESGAKAARFVTIRNGDRLLQLASKDGQSWQLASVSNVAVTNGKVDSLIRGLLHIDPKPVASGDATLLADYGLGSGEGRVLVADATGKALADLRLGKLVSPGSSSRFVRIGDEPKALIAQNLPDIPVSALAWTSISLPQIEAKRIKRVQIIGADLSRLAIERDSDGSFTLVNLNAGERSQPAAIEQLLAVFGSAKAIDLVGADAINWFNATTFLIDTGDGLNMAGQVRVQAGQYWVRFNGSGTAPDAKDINAIRGAAFAISSEQGKKLLAARADYLKP